MGERYSKEAYIDAVRDEEAVSAEEQRAYAMVEQGQRGAELREYDAHKRTEKAQRRINDLYAKGQKEANKLNEQYDRLVSEFDEAALKLREFQDDLIAQGENAANFENKEYRKLVGDFDIKAQRLRDFEIEELGMEDISTGDEIAVPIAEYIDKTEREFDQT